MKASESDRNEGTAAERRRRTASLSDAEAIVFWKKKKRFATSLSVRN